VKKPEDTNMAAPPAPDSPRADPPEAAARAALRHVEEALRGLRFGQVTLIVHDGEVVQVERTERRRLDRPRRKA
jgi:hypothetical protein